MVALNLVPHARLMMLTAVTDLRQTRFVHIGAASRRHIRGIDHSLTLKRVLTIVPMLDLTRVPALREWSC